MKKPLNPAHLAEDDRARHETERRRLETLERLERALQETKQADPVKRKPGDATQNGDPYNTAGPDRDAWTHDPKR